MLQLICLLLCTYTMTAQRFSPPTTLAKPVQEELHGISLIDSYRHLEDKEDPQVIDWTKKQHDATMEYLRLTAPDIKGLNEEIRALFDRDVTSPPRIKKGKVFFSRRKKGELQFKYYALIDGKEQLLFDPVLLDPSGKTSISGVTINKDATKLAIATQSKGAEITDYRIIDAKTGKQIGDVLPGVSNFSWKHDESKVFITPRTKELIENQIPLAVYEHTLGAPLTNAVKLLAPNDAKDFASIYEPEDEQVQVWSTGDFYSNTISFRKIGSSDKPRVIYSSEKFKSYPEFRGKNIYWLSNHEAPNFFIAKTTLENPEFDKAQILVPEGKTVIDGFEVTSTYMLVQDKKDVMSRIMVHDLNGGFIKELTLPEFGNVASMSYDRDEDIIYIAISSFISTQKIYTLNGKTLEWKFFYQDEIPMDLSDIHASLEFCVSKDGTKIPMFIVHKKGINKDGNNPVLITGYGGFNIGMSPEFVGYNASFLKRGGIYVRVGLRGGNEYGESWHLNGMLKKKQHTFDDMIAATEWLIEQKYSNPARIVARGGSNGGLLMGAIATQRPDLYRAIICQVPLLDMIRYHKFRIARYWIPEYGDPDKAEDFGTLLQYSPYHNVKAGVSLPEMLVSVGEFDMRVDPLHGKKFVAIAQSRPEQTKPVMLHVDFDAGHGTGKSIEQIIEDQAFFWRYIFSRLNMN
ncbi:MAG: prolyl oligopeptidase family serine peptidase [Candidatus Kapaibacteriota bacterium]